MINLKKEKKAVSFIRDMVSLYEKHDAKTVYDYDYAGYDLGDVSFAFTEYNGEGFIVHWPIVDREVINKLGDKLFMPELKKTVHNPDADKISKAVERPSYTLACKVYSGKIEYILTCNAYNEKSKNYESREKIVSLRDLI